MRRDASVSNTGKEGTGATTEHSSRDATAEATDSSTQLREARKRGGGKLGRTETVTVRLDPKLRYLAELAARKYRRTLSSFIEWALEQQTNSVCLGEEYGDISIKDEAESLWDVDDADRFARLAIRHPNLLTHDEQILWKLVRENGYVWRGHFGPSRKWTWEVKEKSLIAERLRKHWDDFLTAAKHEDGTVYLPKWVEEGEPKKAAPITEAPITEDDIPF